MAKKWYGIEKLVDKEINIPNDLWQYEEAMRGIPNHDKTDGAKRYFNVKSIQFIKLVMDI